MTADDLDSATVLVTGGTDGIGRAVSRRLADRGATVLVTGRDERKADAVLSMLDDAAGDGDVLLADFADPEEVRELARIVRDQVDGLDVLINNAGTWQDAHRTARWNDEAVEYTFAVNHLAHFLLTNLLVPELQAAAPARVVTVSSGLHGNGSLDPLESVIDPPSFDGQQAYADSKLANVLFTYELADRLSTAVTATALHPGTIPATSLSRHTSGLPSIAWTLVGLLPFTDDVEDGARAIEYLATDPTVEGVTGAYFGKRERTEPAAAAHDESLRTALWERSADLAGLPPSVPEVDPLAEQ